MASNVPDEPSNVPGEPGNVRGEPIHVSGEPEAKAEEPMEVTTGESVEEGKEEELPQESEGPSTSASGEDKPNLSSRIEAQRGKLQDIIVPGFGLTVKLYSCKVLTSREKSLIDAKEITYDKNQLLLDFILKSGKYEEFLQALRESGQTHVANWIEGNGVYNPEFGKEWPLREKELEFLRINLEHLMGVLDTEHGFLEKLLSKKVISDRQMEYIKKKSTSYDCNEAFLDILKQSSVEAYNLTIICLQESNQEAVSKLFEKGGAIVPIHTTLEGDSIDEVEELIVNEMKKVCLENKPLLEDIDEDHLWVRLRPMIIAVKKGKSIVLFISCCTVEEFQQLCTMVDNDNDKMKLILERLFNLLLQNLHTKVLLVTIYENDKENAKKLFDRELLRDKKYDEHFQRLRLQLKNFIDEPMDVTTGESVEERKGEELRQESEDPRTSASVGEPRMSGYVSKSPPKRQKFSGTGTQAVADEDTIPAILRNNFEFFKEHIRPKKLIPKLASLEILTDNNKRFISTLKSESDKNHEILNIIRGSSVKNYYEFINCLRETEQGPIANVAEKGGVTVKMKIAHESIKNIAEIEKEIVTKLNKLHESASPKSDDLWHLLSQLKIGGMEILSARYDDGIVTWIWCRSNNAITKLEKLTKDKRLGNLFSALFRCLQIPTVPKINDVLWENPDVDFVNRKLCKWAVKTSAAMMTGLKISGIAMMGNKIITVFQNRSALLVFSCDEHGNTFPEKEEPLKKIDAPMHMAASLNLRCLYITDRTNNIYKVNIEPAGKVDEPILWVEGSSAEQINSLSVGRNDNLLVLKDGKPSKLEIYSKDDKRVEVLKLPDQIRHPNNAAEVSNGDFIISYHSDLTPGGICRITNKGDWVSRLDLGFNSFPIQELSKEEEIALSSLSEGIPYLKHLDHFTLDDEDQVYACDADQYVVFLDSELNMEEAIEVKGLKNPSRIHYLKDKKELLLVHGTDQDSFSLLCSK